MRNIEVKLATRGFEKGDLDPNDSPTCNKKCIFFYLGFLSWTFTIHKTASRGWVGSGGEWGRGVVSI